MSSFELFADRYDIEEYCAKERAAQWDCARNKGSCESQQSALNNCARRFGVELNRLNKSCHSQIDAFAKCRSANSTSECRKEATAVHDCYSKAK